MVEPEIILILVGNKIDKVDERKVTKEQGQLLGEKLNIPYIETSALDKDVVEEAFRTLAFMFLEGMKITEKF